MPHDYNAPRRACDTAIAKARLAKGMTQKALAEAVGAKPSQISAWERGAIPPSIDALMRIANALEVDAATLFPPQKQEKNNVKALRTAKGMTQIELAKIIGVTQSTYSAYESGAYELPMDKLPLIAEALGVSVDDIEIYNEKSLITFYRKRKGLKQSELAEKTGLSTSALSNFETGRFKPSPATMQRIADALDVTVEMLGGSDE